MHLKSCSNPFGILGSVEGLKTPSPDPTSTEPRAPSQTLSGTENVVNNKCTKSSLLYRTRAASYWKIKPKHNKPKQKQLARLFMWAHYVYPACMYHAKGEINNQPTKAWKCNFGEELGDHLGDELGDHQFRDHFRIHLKTCSSMPG